MSNPSKRNELRAAVVGSGFGGLAAAIRLQAAGFRTVVFEALDKPGGRASVITDQGYVFDTGPTVITAPECLEELYALAGRRLSDHVELLPVEPFYRLQWRDGDRFDYGTSMDRMIEQIAKRDPRDVDGYDRFLELSRKTFEAGYTELVSTPFLRFADMAKAATKLISLRSDRSVYRTVARYIHDERLRQAFTFHTLLIGGNPFRTSSIYTLIHYLERKWGVHFPRGGTNALVASLVELFEDLGGELRLSAPVTRIEVDTGPADTTHRITAGETKGEAFDLTVSNADVHHTYAAILGHDPRARKARKKLERMQWSMSLFVVYFGTDRTYDDLAHHTILFGPRYKSHLREIFEGSKLPDDFSLYLHSPTVTDSSLAPPGGAAFYVLSPVPHLGKARIDWESEAEPYADRILASLERFLPDLRKHIVTRHVFTPLDFQRRLRAFQGNGFSVAPTLTQSAYFRPHNRDRRIPALYFAGAGTHPGAGVPGVINSAKATASVIIDDFGLPRPA
jgi:phytoene desaturase